MCVYDHMVPIYITYYFITMMVIFIFSEQIAKEEGLHSGDPDNCNFYHINYCIPSLI